MSAIDEKKDNAAIQKTKNNVPLFLENVLHSLKKILMYVILSAIVFYATKLAAQNIIPDDLDAFPFKPGSEPPPADKLPQTKEEDIFGKTYKIKFLPEIHNVFIDFLRGKPAAAAAPSPPPQAEGGEEAETAASAAKESVVSAFLRKQFLCSLYYNFVLLTMFFKLLSGWNEHAIVLLGPILFIFFMGFLCTFGGIGFIYYYFINLSILMKGESTILKIILPVIFVCLLICIVFVLPFIQTPILLYCVATLICYSSELTPVGSSTTTEKTNVLKFGTVFASHYQNLIMAAVCVYVTKAAYANLGTSEGIASIIVAILMAMGTFGIGLFKTPQKAAELQKGGSKKKPPRHTPKQLKTTIKYLYRFLNK